MSDAEPLTSIGRDLLPTSRDEIPDRWTAEADALVEALQDSEQSLRAKRRSARVAGALITASLVVFVLVAKSGVFTFVCVVSVLLAASLAVPLWLRPRRQALEAIAGKLKILDPRCDGCGYALRHLCSRRCPECGRVVALPPAEQIEAIVRGGSVTVAQGSVESDLGYVVALLMVLTAAVLGKLFGPSIGCGAMAAPPIVFLVFLAVRRARLARRVSRDAICDSCGRTTLMAEDSCVHCGEGLLADHVYSRPGLRGNYDPRLYRTWAQLIGGSLVCAMLVVLALGVDIAKGFGAGDKRTVVLIQIVLCVFGLIILRRDLKLRERSRLQVMDKTIGPVCHRCLGSLRGMPANGTCPKCGRQYRAIELAGGRA